MDRDDEIQSQVQRLVRKQKYKQLLEEGAQLSRQAETADPVEIFHSVINMVETSNILLDEGRVKDRVDGSTEVMMDAQVIKMSHDIAHAAMRKMDASQFADGELAAIILSNFGEASCSENWANITREAAAIFRTTKHSQSLYGTFEHEPIATQQGTKQRAKRQQVNFGQVKRPDTVGKLQRQERSAQNLNLVFNQIVRIYEQRRKPIPYYELIVDPQNFMNTVDNAFLLSFLIRDGRIAIIQDEQFNPMLRPSSQQEQKQAPLTAETTQAILGLNPRKWRELIEQYQIDEPMLILNRDELKYQSQN